MSSPTLLVAQHKVMANLRRMAARAQRHGVAFRPHFKTHQSHEVARWIQDLGVTEIAVTSLRMAHDFVDGGWENITIAMPLNISELPEINLLAERVPLTVFVNNEVAAQALSKKGHPSIRCFTEIDAGYGRSGISFRDQRSLSRLLEILGPDRFRGYYAHSGHSYGAKSLSEIEAIHQELLAAIEQLRGLASTPLGCEFAIGDTPACSTQEDYRGVTAIGPGNFVFYDLVQAALGACRPSDIAVCLAAPVLEVQSQRNQVILHAGWVQLGKDQLPDGTYGQLVHLGEDFSWNADQPIGNMIKLSQEHGTAAVAPEWAKQLQPGDMVGILPVHACATVHGMRATGSQKIIP